MGVRFFQFMFFAFLGCMILEAADSSGISATLVPDKVKPGDVFELRVVMDRAEYGRFSLDIPAQPHLHRIAVEVVPVSFSDGRYRQSEKWLLQADSSGNFTVKDGKVLLETGGTLVTVPLPELKLVVTPYTETDSSTEPAGLPEDPALLERVGRWWPWLLVPIIAISLIVVIRKKRTQIPRGEELDDNLLALAASELEQGNASSPVLGKLIHDESSGLSEEAREKLVELFYAGRGDPQALASLLRKEAAR